MIVSLSVSFVKTIKTKSGIWLNLFLHLPLPILHQPLRRYRQQGVCCRVYGGFVVGWILIIVRSANTSRILSMEPIWVFRLRHKPGRSWARYDCVLEVRRHPSDPFIHPAQPSDDV